MNRELALTVVLSALLLALPAAAGTQRASQPTPRQQSAAREQERERIRATQQQRAQLATCARSGDRVSEGARQMADAAKGAGANNAEFRLLHDQLKQDIRTMQQDRDRFMSGLSEEQRPALQNRIRKLDQARDRLNDRIRLLDDEMAKPIPDPKRIREFAQGVDRGTRDFQKRLRETGKDMGVGS